MIDIQNIIGQFKRVGSIRRAMANPFIFDWSQLINPPALLKEFKGRLSHALYDDTDGWHTSGAFEADGGFVGDMTGDTAGTHTGAVDLVGDQTFGFDDLGQGSLLSLDVGTSGAAEVSLDATGVASDVFKEKTPGAGCLVDGCTIKDGKAAAALTADACSGNAATATAMAGALVRTTAEARPCQLIPLVDFAQITTGPGVALAASKTGSTAMGFVMEPEGRTLTGWKLNGVYDEASAITVTAQLFKRTGGVDAAVGAVITPSRNAGALSAAETLASPEVLTANVKYYVLVTATTGVGDTMGVYGIESISK